MIYFSEISWRHSRDFGTLVPEIPNFLYVCESVSWLTSLLKLDTYRDNSSSVWYLSEIFWTHSLDVCTLVPNNYEFLTWNSNISVLPGLNLLHLNTIISLVGHLVRPLVLLLNCPTTFYKITIYAEASRKNKLFGPYTRYWAQILGISSTSPHLKLGLI